jgi:hypothetical protein
VYVTLTNEIAKRLAAYPEDGMGYQIVDVTLADGRRIEGAVVINSSIVELPDALGRIGSTDIVGVLLQLRESER